MSVDPEELERAHKLVGNALYDAFEGHPIQPVETGIGIWRLWPARSVIVAIEETRYWSYGTPGAGTGELQVLIQAPYGIKNRVKPKKGFPFDDKFAKKAAKTARQWSDARAAAVGMDEKAEQMAYLAGYSAVSFADPDEIESLWKPRAATVRNESWSPLHEAFSAFFEAEYKKHPERWTSLETNLSPSRLYDMAFRGGLNALDDWAMGAGILEPETADEG